MLSLGQIDRRYSLVTLLLSALSLMGGACGAPAAPPEEGHSARHPPKSVGSTTSSGAKTTSPDPAKEPKVPVLAPLPEDSRVLHLGDSFAGALGYELKKELKAHSVQGFLKYEKSTYIPTWAWSKELPSILARYRPDLVLITLGANELQIPEPKKRAKTIQRLVSRLGGRPCVWIGIPLWEGANPELMDVIRANVEPCLYLDSTALLPDLARAKDGIHPSLPARARWAATVVGWLQQRVAPGNTWRWRDSSP